MILNLYVTRNKKSGQFGQIRGEIFSQEQAKESYATSKLEAPADQSKLLEELEVYHLGTYDTATGKIDACEPVFLLDLGAVQYGNKKEN